MLARAKAFWKRAPLRARVVLALLPVVVAAAVAVPLAVALPSGQSGPCTGSHFDDFTCYQAYLDSLVDTKGAEAALAELARLNATNSYVLSTCHTLAHAIGHEAFARYKSVDAASRHGNYTCWSGYYHGVYEVYMSRFTDRQLLKVIPTICHRPADNPYAFDYYNCIHGLGHGVTIRFGNDPFKALPYCDVFGEDWQRANCYTGVFMQNIIVDSKMHKSIRLKADDPMYPCDAVAEKYKGACYLGQTSYVLRVLDYDYRKAFALCDGVEPGFVSTCYVSMGRDISGNYHRDAKSIVEHCSLGAPAHQGDCYVGAVRNDVFNDHALANANALCAILPAQLRTTCEKARDSAADTL
jgi:hypothetical protein